MGSCQAQLTETATNMARQVIEINLHAQNFRVEHFPIESLYLCFNVVLHVEKYSQACVHMGTRGLVYHFVSRFYTARAVDKDPQDGTGEREGPVDNRWPWHRKLPWSSVTRRRVTSEFRVLQGPEKLPISWSLYSIRYLKYTAKAFGR